MGHLFSHALTGVLVETDLTVPEGPPVGHALTGVLVETDRWGERRAVHRVTPSRAC